LPSSARHRTRDPDPDGRPAVADAGHSTACADGARGDRGLVVVRRGVVSGLGGPSARQPRSRARAAARQPAQRRRARRRRFELTPSPTLFTYVKQYTSTQSGARTFAPHSRTTYKTIRTYRASHGAGTLDSI